MRVTLSYKNSSKGDMITWELCIEVKKLNIIIVAPARHENKR